MKYFIINENLRKYPMVVNKTTWSPNVSMVLPFYGRTNPKRFADA